MFIGGLSALLLQSLHPLAMAGVDEHSGYRGDPWGRLARTSRFLAVTTYGSADDARRQIAAVRAVHRRVVGDRPGRAAVRGVGPAPADVGPRLRGRRFLRSFQRYGSSPLTPAEADEYVAQTGRVATDARRRRRARRPSPSVAAMLAAYRPELREHAGGPGDGALPRRDAAAAARPAPGVPADRRAPPSACCPRWARWPLRLPWLPLTEATLGRASGDAVTRVIRWALPAAAGLA